MPNQVDLNKLAVEYAAELKKAESAMAQYRKLLESVRLLQTAQTAETIADHIAEMAEMVEIEPMRSIPDVVDYLLDSGPRNVAALSLAIMQDFPELADTVKNLKRSVSSALVYGRKAGRYERIGRGVYSK